MLKKTLSALLRSNRRKCSTSPARRRAVIAAAALETLEQRRMLSAVTIPTGSNVQVSLTSGGTVITAVVNGTNTYTYTKSLYTGIIVNGSSGNNDTLSVDANVDLPVTINGSDGNDTITGGGANDSLVGGAGDDTYDISGPSNRAADA